MTRETKRPLAARPAGASGDLLGGEINPKVTDAAAVDPGTTGPLTATFDAFPGATVTNWDDSPLAAAAITYAARGQRVFPLAVRDKMPLIPKYRGGRGVLDATDDIDVTAARWSRSPWANIGGRVPDGVVIIDIDPKNGGDVTWRQLTDAKTVPVTRTTISGRGDGGVHLWFRHPGGSIGGLGTGIDVLTSNKYVVLPPSVHPDTGRVYRWADPGAPVVAMPNWLVRALRPAPKAPRVATARPVGGDHDRPGDWFDANHTWDDVLTPNNWKLVHGDGDSDGSQWRHPHATTPVSATTRHGLLFVYSTNTPLPVTECNNPAGLTRFRAWALLDHAGDFSAAAKAAAELRKVAR